MVGTYRGKECIDSKVERFHGGLRESLFLKTLSRLPHMIEPTRGKNLDGSRVEKSIIIDEKIYLQTPCRDHHT